MEEQKYCEKHKLNYINNDFGYGCPECNKEPQNLPKARAHDAMLAEVQAIANDALYFDDSSDYKTSLWRILRTVAPEMFNENKELKKKLKYSGN